MNTITSLKTPSQQLQEAQEYTQRHLAELAYELLEWHKTGILRDGKVRELARLCDFAGPSALAVAEKLISDECLEIVARAQTHESS